MHKHRWAQALLAGAALLAVGGALAAPVPGEGFVSVIDQGGFTTGKAYRMLPFVEFQQVGAPGVELSAPYVTSLAARDVAGQAVFQWSQFQDRVKYASIVGLNSSLVPGLSLSPEDLYLSNCVLQIPADVSIAVKQGLAGVTNVALSLPALQLSDTRHPPALPDDVGLYGPDKVAGSEKLPTLTPRVPRTGYCADATLDVLPDVPFVYAPGVRTCLFGFCLSTPNFPRPLYINWPGLSARMQLACTNAAKSYVDVYQKEMVASILKDMPLALNWDGVLSLHTSTGANGLPAVTSGVTMSPVIGETSMLPSALRASSENPLFGAYLALPRKGTLNGFAPGVAVAAKLEEIKRALEPGLLGEQEEHGYVSLFQVHQSLDTVLDARPSLFWASSLVCDVFAGCVGTPLPLPAPDVVVTGPACAVPNPATAGAGSTTFSELRYHQALISVPEALPVPNLTGDPLRTTPGRLPGGD